MMSIKISDHSDISSSSYRGQSVGTYVVSTSCKYLYVPIFDPNYLSQKLLFFKILSWAVEECHP